MFVRKKNALKSSAAGQEAVVVDRRDGYTPLVGPDSLILYVVGYHFRNNVINFIFK